MQVPLTSFHYINTSTITSSSKHIPKHLIPQSTNKTKKKNFFNFITYSFDSIKIIF